MRAKRLENERRASHSVQEEAAKSCIGATGGRDERRAGSNPNTSTARKAGTTGPRSPKTPGPTKARPMDGPPTSKGAEGRRGRPRNPEEQLHRTGTGGPPDRLTIRPGGLKQRRARGHGLKAGDPLSRPPQTKSFGATRIPGGPGCRGPRDDRTTQVEKDGKRGKRAGEGPPAPAAGPARRDRRTLTGRHGSRGRLRCSLVVGVCGRDPFDAVVMVPENVAP